MNKFLICLTFRDFNKKNKNFFDQLNFVKNILNHKEINIDFAVTQFKEKNVNKIVKIIPKNKLYYFKEQIPNEYRWSHSRVFLNALKIFIKKDYDYLVWTTTDIIVKKEIFKYLESCKKNSIYTFYPNINIQKNNKTFFGMDFFAFKISKNDAKKLITIFKRYENYDWGIFEHYLFSIHNFLNLPIRNLFKYGKILKNSNIKKKQVFNIQTISWQENQKRFEKFLKNKKISILYSRGSMYYLCLKLFKLQDLNLKLLLIYFKMFYYLIKRLLINER